MVLQSKGKNSGKEVSWLAIGMGVLGLFWVSLSVVYGEADHKATSVAMEGQPADGRRLRLRGGDISIDTLPGWTVYTQHAGLTVLMEAPQSQPLEYRRTLQVARFGGAKFMDEVTAQEFDRILVRKFSTLTTSIKDFRLRNHQLIEISHERPAILFYTEFVVDDVNLMQAHLLVSDDRQHFLITYTDVAAHFEGHQAGQIFQEVWQVMTGVTLRRPSPKRLKPILWITGGIFTLVSGVGGFALVRYLRYNRKLKRKVQDSFTETEDPVAAAADRPVWTLPPVSDVSYLTGPDEELIEEEEAS